MLAWFWSKGKSPGLEAQFRKATSYSRNSTLKTADSEN
jgi:hypothetical protein